MNHPRAWHTATVLPDGRILVAGGAHANEGLTSAEVFDPVGRTWTDVAPSNAAHSSNTATLLPDGRVLIAGGMHVPRSAEIFDPATGLWSVTGEMIASRTYHTATLLLDGRVLVAGGIDDTNTTVASTELWFGAPPS
jgi:hypothetical protein